MWKATFWRAAFERAISTFAQTFLAVVAFDEIPALDQVSIDWAGTLYVSLIAAGLSVLKSVVAANIGNNGPSLNSAEKLAPAAPEVHDPNRRV